MISRWKIFCLACICNHPINMSETAWNGIYMVIGAGLSALFGIFAGRYQRCASQKEEFRFFISSKIMKVHKSGFIAFYRDSKPEIQLQMIRLNLFLWSWERNKINSAWSAFCAIKEEDLADQNETEEYWLDLFEEIKPGHEAREKCPSVILKRHLIKFLKV